MIAVSQVIGIRIFLVVALVALGGWQTQAAGATATVNLKNYGAIGDNVADDGPALQKALDALANAGGGTLIVPQGRYAIITPVVKDFTGRASSITILGVESLTPVDPTDTANDLSKGLDLVSEFTPKTGSTETAISIAGRVADANGLAFSGVTVTLDGSNGATTTTDSDGNFSFQLTALGSYTLTPSPKSYVFQPSALTFNQLVADQTVYFSGSRIPVAPILISHEDSTRAVALDAVLRTDEPFQFTYDYLWSSDRRTRILLYAADFDLPPGEPASAVSADAQDASGRVYPLTVEYVGEVEVLPWLTRVVVRLNDDLKDVGDVLVRIKYRQFSSNRVRVGIGHVGGGPPDDPGAVPTPGRP